MRLMKRVGLLSACLVVLACGGGGGVPGGLGGGGKGSATQVVDQASALPIVIAAISSDGIVGGSVKVGPDLQPCTWANGAATVVNNPTGNATAGRVYAVARGGTTVAGVVTSSNRAFWASGANTSYIDPPAGVTVTHSRPMFISENGRIVSGRASTSGPTLYWVWEEGSANYTVLPDGFELLGMSPNGDELLGMRSSKPTVRTRSGSERSLKMIVGDAESYAQSVSAGGVYIGSSSRPADGNNPTQTQGVYWDANGDPRGIGWIPGANQRLSGTRAISADGQVIFGEAVIANGQQSAVVWSRNTGLIDLRSLVPGYEDCLWMFPAGMDASGKKILVQAFTSTTESVPLLITLP